MSNDLAIVNSNNTSLSATEIRKQVNLIQEVMKNVMIGPTKENPEGVHYGIVPGCKKPSLLKPGAEKLLMTFRLGVEYEEISGTVESDSFIFYKINCKLFHIPTGNIIGHGRGVCNSKEKKYKTRMVYANKATDEEKAIGKEEERRGDKGNYKVLIVPQDPWDIANTLYKMACKRAMIAAVINATAAGDIFTQDVEDLSEGTIIDDEPQPKSGKPPVNMPEEEKGPVKAVDLVTLLQGKVKDQMSVIAFFLSKTVSTKPDKKDSNKTWTITEYTVGDLPKDPTTSVVIKSFAKTIEAVPGKAVLFVNVEIQEYNGKIQYVAKEVSISE